MFASNRLNLRPWKTQDTRFIDAILGDPDVMQFSDTGVLGEADQAVWVQNVIEAKPSYGLPGNLAIEHKQTSQVLGYVSLARDLHRVGRRDAEIGFRLARHAWGRGYAIEAVKRMIEGAQSSGTTDRVVAIIDPNNHRSVRLIKKIGMVHDGEVMFEGYDYPDHLYALRLESRPSQGIAGK